MRTKPKEWIDGIPRRFGRRLFLGGAALTGTSFFRLPWLEAFGSDASAQPASAPLRLILVTVGHSLHVDAGSSPEWAPAQPGPLGELPPMLSPLASFRDRMVILDGIDNLVTRLVRSNGHNASSRTLLTCMPHRDALADDGSLRSSAPELTHASDAAGPSIDWTIAQALGARPLSLRVGEQSPEHRRHYRPSLSEDIGDPNPRAAFDGLFGHLGADPAPTDPRELLLRRRRSILDSVHGTYRALAQRVGSEDRQRLESHASLIREFELELDRTVRIVCDEPSLETGTLPSAFEDGRGLHDDVIARAQNSLAVTALACQATPVASIHYSNIQGNRFPFLGQGSDLVQGNWHAVVHIDEGTNAQRMRAMQWYHEMLADLLAKLEAVREGDGTLADHTVVVFTSSLALNWHSTDGLPVFLFGRPNGSLPTGRFLRYGAAGMGPRRSLGDLWLTLRHIMKDPAPSFGWDRGTDPIDGRPFVIGPLTELLG